MGQVQAARTYLERKHEEYPEASLDALIGHALQALTASLAEGELTATSCIIAYVGKDQDFKELDEASLQPYIQALRDAEGTISIVTLSLSRRPVLADYTTLHPLSDTWTTVQKSPPLFVNCCSSWFDDDGFVELRGHLEQGRYLVI